MKLRLRSMEPRVGGAAAPETHRVEMPPTATLADLRALLAAKLSAAQPVPAESVRFSLNRCEELVSPDPAAALPDIGLASGDLVYFTRSPLWVPAPPAQHPAPVRNPTSASASIAKPAGVGTSSSSQMEMEVNPTPMESDPADVVMAEALDTTKTWSSFVLRDLKRGVETVVGAEGTVVGRLVAALHAALLDVGFCNSNPTSLPQNWPSGASGPLIIKYTVPEFVSELPAAEEGKVAVLNFSVMGNFIMVYGHVPGAQTEISRLCLELPKLEPLLYLDGSHLDRVQERGILELWRVLKDEICLPLMVSLCQLNNLRLPPCLMALPAELKTRILEFVPGLELARFECTCKEMRTLAADDNLWNKFVTGSRGSKSAKAMFAEVLAAKKQRQKRRVPQFPSYGWGNQHPYPFFPHRFPVIGGDSDRLPCVGNLGHPGRGFGNQRRNVSPNCNLIGGRLNFF